MNKKGGGEGAQSISCEKVQQFLSLRLGDNSGDSWVQAVSEPVQNGMETLHVELQIVFRLP